MILCILVLQKFLTWLVLNSHMLVLTGNPGVGKHTVAEELAKTLDYEIVDINKEALKAGMPKQDDSVNVDVGQMKILLKDRLVEKSLVVGHLAIYVVSKTQFPRRLFLERTLMILFRFMKKETILIVKKMIILEVKF